MANHHDHDHGSTGHTHHMENDSRLKITLYIVVGIMVVEAIGGLMSHSLALVSDAGHMLIDALSLALSLFAITMAKRPSTFSKTFGYHRGEIMAALVNGVVLVLLSAGIFYESYQRFFQPHDINAPLMLVVAIIGLVSNIAGIVLLRSASESSLNVKAAFWHILGDSVASVGVIVAAVVIQFTGYTNIDPIVAAVIAVIILWGAISVVRESMDILMETVPKHIELDKVIETLKSIPGVLDLHDLHIWTITSGIYALSTHLLIEDQRVSKSATITAAANAMLSDRFRITHTTLQLECDRCDTCADGVVCDIRKLRNHA
jgi:cobalt-zinc-cadmium efflux system protein